MKFDFNISRLYKGMFFAGTTLLAAACLPESDKKSLDLGDTPEATFTITPIDGATNTYRLVATEQDLFQYSWNFGGGDLTNYVTQSIDTIYYPNKGEYIVRLMASNANGSGVTEQTIVVAEDDPEGCSGFKALLTGCETGDSKTWVLLQPEGGALFVGPPGFGSAWWSNSAADVNDPSRVCMFDDEYTFTKTGEFIYEAFGDVRVDDEGGNPWPTDIGLGIGCHAESAIPAKYQDWNSGTFAFQLLPGNKLKVIGVGAHLGLYKVGETGTTATPDAAITYEIVSLTEDKLVVQKAYDWGGWRFTFKAKE